MTHVNQIIFNKVVKHLATQDKRSSNENGACMYRGENGLKCAIGALIGDKHYKPNMDDYGLMACESPIKRAVARTLKRKLGTETGDLLRELQMIHDGPSYYEGFCEITAQRLEVIARKYGLNTQVLNRV